LNNVCHAPLIKSPPFFTSLYCKLYIYIFYIVGVESCKSEISYDLEVRNSKNGVSEHLADSLLQSSPSTSTPPPQISSYASESHDIQR